MSATSAERRVQRLHLTAPDETLAGRGVRLLDDALRTASMPDARGRLIFVRRFSLGRFSADISSQALALAIERRIESLWSRAIHVSDAGAGTAEAVWFRDTLEAHTLLALRILEGAPVDEWFWPLVAPAIAASGDRRERLRAVVTALARHPEAPAALPAFVQHIVSRARSHVRTLVECLDESDGEALLALAPPAARAVLALNAWRDVWTPARLRAADPLHAIAVLIETHALTPLDARVRWVVAMLIASGAVTADSFRGQAREYRRWRDVDAPMAAEPDGNRTPAPQSLTGNVPNVIGHAARSDGDVGDAVANDTRELHPDRGRSTARTEALAANALPPTHDAGIDEPLLTPHAPGMRLVQLPWPDGEPTAAGGLLFLLPVLERLGYAAWLDAAPEWSALAIERRLFAIVCSRLRLPAEDPAWALTEIPLRAKAPQHFCAPMLWAADRWVTHRSTHPTCGIADQRAPWRRTTTATSTRLHDASGRLLLASWRGRRPHGISALIAEQPLVQNADLDVCDTPLTEAIAQAWLTACRRWLRRYARIGIATLVTRPARLTLTPTHADVDFELGKAHLAVRRAGLDLDPGWVPWLGRVVAFHYRNVID